MWRRLRVGADDYLPMTGRPFIVAQGSASNGAKDFSAQDRHPPGECVAGDVAGLRQVGGHPPVSVNFVNCRARPREIRGAEKPHRRYHHPDF